MWLQFFVAFIQSENVGFVFFLQWEQYLTHFHFLAFFFIVKERRVTLFTKHRMHVRVNQKKIYHQPGSFVYLVMLKIQFLQLCVLDFCLFPTLRSSLHKNIILFLCLLILSNSNFGWLARPVRYFSFCPSNFCSVSVHPLQCLSDGPFNFVRYILSILVRLKSIDVVRGWSFQTFVRMVVTWWVLWILTFHT